MFKSTLSGVASKRDGIKLYVVEVAQKLDALFGTLQLGGVVRRGFHLAQFAADDFVAGFVVAGDVDFVDVDFSARFDVQDEIDGFGCGVRQRLYADFAVCVACRAHAVLNLAQNGGHLLAFVPFAGLHGQQFFQFGSPGTSLVSPSIDTLPQRKRPPSWTVILMVCLVLSSLVWMSVSRIRKSK